MLKKAVILLIFSCLGFVSGCSTINPHVRPSNKGESRGDMIHWQDGDFAGGLGAAINRASSFRMAYYDAVKEQSMTRNLIGLSLIPLSASALYLGFASNANAELAAGLGLGAAGLYGIGNLLHSSPRQSVYLQGSRAIGCAVMAMRPLLYTTDSYKALAGAINGSVNGAAATSEAARALSKALDVVDDPAIVDPAQAELQNTDALISQMIETRSQALLLKRRIDTSGVTLDKTVEDIATRVSDEILKTEPDLASIMNVAGNLGAWAGQFGAVPKVVPAGAGIGVDKPPPGKDKDATGDQSGDVAQDPKAEEKKKLSTLRRANQDLRGQIQLMADDVTAAAALAKGSGVLEQCNVTPVDLGFSIFPDVQKLDMDQGTVKVISVTDRSGIPRVALTTPGNDAVKMELDSTAGFISARITASANAAPGELYHLHIANATLRDVRVIPINVRKSGGTRQAVQEPDARNPSTPETLVCNEKSVAAGGWKDWLKESEKVFITNLEEIRKMQRFFGVTDDGCIGNETRGKIREYQQARLKDLELDRRPEAELGTLTEITRNSILSESNGSP